MILREKEGSYLNTVLNASKKHINAHLIWGMTILSLRLQIESGKVNQSFFKAEKA